MASGASFANGVNTAVFDRSSTIAKGLKDQLSAAAALLTPESPDYETSIARWSETCTKRAAAVIQVATAQDVGAVLKYAKKEKIPFAVNGGGHSTSGASACENGIVIDLRKMKSVTVDPETKTILAGGGTVWRDVDEAAAKYGLATVGGTVNHTGVGGLTLGGGYGWLSGQYGLTIDNLLGVEIVLYDGTVVRAAEKENHELFWAVRGAGPNFGVVTEFVFKGHEQKTPVFSGVMIFSPDKIPGIVDFMNKVHERSEPRAAMNIGISAPPPIGMPVIFAAVFFNGPQAEAEAFFKPLLDIEPIMNQTGVMPYEAVNGIMNETAGSYGGRKLFGGTAWTYPLQASAANTILEEFQKFCSQNERVNESVVLIEAFPNMKIGEVANDAMSFANRGNHYNIGMVWKWYDPAQDDTIRAHNRAMAAKFKELCLLKEIDGVGLYSNYVAQTTRPQEIFGDNLEKLRKLKARYDPDNLFNKSHNLLMN